MSDQIGSTADKAGSKASQLADQAFSQDNVRSDKAAQGQDAAKGYLDFIKDKTAEVKENMNEDNVRAAREQASQKIDQLTQGTKDLASSAQAKAQDAKGQLQAKKDQSTTSTSSAEGSSA